MNVIQVPHLPEYSVTCAAVSAAYPKVIQDLSHYGIEVLPVPVCPDLPEPVSSHADMLLYHAGGNRLVLYPYDQNLKQAISSFGFSVLLTKDSLGCCYPEDVKLNYCRFGSYLIGNFDRVSPCREISLLENQDRLRRIPVRQGYATCSLCLPDLSSAITADPGIASALEQEGIEVLRISPGFVRLPGYDTGFFGGCCGKLGPDLLYVTGKLSSHPDGEKIREFLSNRGISVVEGPYSELVDLGSILPLTEETPSQFSWSSNLANTASG